MSAPETPAARLDALRAAKLEREKGECEADTLLQVAELELEESLASKYGKRGKRWDIVRTTEGPIGLLRGDSMLVKQFRIGLEQAGKDDADLYPVQFAFVLPQIVHPARDVAGAWLNEMQGLAVRCQDVLIALHRGEDSTQVGKR